MLDAVRRAAETASSALEMPAPPSSAPSILRRVGAMIYEGLLLLALLLTMSFPVAGLKGAALVGVPHAAFQLYLAAVVAVYFVWCWMGGQTLPMKTWHFRVVDTRGSPLSAGRSLLRLMAAAVFLGPACVGLVLLFFPQRVDPGIAMWMFVPAMATILFARFDADRQFLHDRIAGTRLLEIRA